MSPGSQLEISPDPGASVGTPSQCPKVSSTVSMGISAHAMDSGHHQDHASRYTVPTYMAGVM